MITYEYRLPHDINSFRRSVGWYELSPRQLNCALKSSVFAITALDGEKEVGSARVVGDGGYQFCYCTSRISGTGNRQRNAYKAYGQGVVGR